MGFATTSRITFHVSRFTHESTMPTMPRLSNRLTHNTAVKLASELMGRAASFVLVILAARQLGEAGFGLYNYGLALGFVLAQLADMGLQIVISREVAVQGQRAQPLARMAFHLKGILSLAVLGSVCPPPLPFMRTPWPGPCCRCSVWPVVSGS
jgi:O-antigen/teichoic acid export membrane protein